MSSIDRLVKTLVETGARSATKFESPKQVTRVTRRRYSGSKRRGSYFSSKSIEVTVTIGRPNHKEREFIKRCQKAGEPFPVKKPRLRFPAKRG